MKENRFYSYKIYPCYGKRKPALFPEWLQQAAGHETTVGHGYS